jgi:putative phage-type endonuclease
MAGRRVTPAGIMIVTAKEIAEDRAAWLRARRFREGVGYCIGSSDTPSILGIKDAGTPVSTWHEKVHALETPDNPAMMWGRLDEDTTARYWRDRNRSTTQAVGLIANVDQPWHQTTLDRLVLECPLDRSLRRRCGLEVKHRGAFGSRRWHREVPDDVLAQMCHQIFVTGFDHMHYAVRIGGNDYHQGVVQREEDAKTIAFVLKHANAFREQHLAGEFVPVLEVDPPSGLEVPTGRLAWMGREVEPAWPIEEKAASLIELDKLLHPERAGLRTVEELAPAMELAEARARLGRATAEEKKAKARLLRQADGARWVNAETDNGSELVYEFAPRERTKVDLDILREKYPEAYADPEVTIHSTSWQINIADAFKVKKLPEPEEDS